MPPKNGPLVLIDGHNLFIRNYVRSPYMNTNGERAGGTTGMIVSVRKLVNDLNPSNIMVIWDGEGGSQRRRSIYKEYKAGRKVRLNEEYDFGETPEARLENMRHQRNVASEYLALLGVPQVRADGVEADDLMAHVAGKMNHPYGCVIVTTDQDLLQLISENVPDHKPDCSELTKADSSSTCSCPPPSSEVRVLSPIKKVMYDRTRFISDYGVLPENFRLVKALTGDKSDNIEGIKGFGDKTVAKSFPFLLQRFSTPKDILDAAASLKSVSGKLLVEKKDRFLENLKLVDLSDPMLSATAAHTARAALSKDIGCKEVDFRVRCIRDGVTFSGDNFMQPFRELTMRRRRFLKEWVHVPEDDITDEELAIVNTPAANELREVLQEVRDASVHTIEIRATIGTNNLVAEEDYFLPKRADDTGDTE